MILKPFLKPVKKNVEVKIPKFSLNRVLRILDIFELELHEQGLDMDAGTLVLSVDAIDLPKRSRLIARLQKRAIPKSEWTELRDTQNLYGNISGKLVSLLIFSYKKKV